MNDKFDELARSLVQPVTRRAALKKFGLGLAGIALTSLGLADKSVAAEPAPGGHNKCLDYCKQSCAKNFKRNTPAWQNCWQTCAANCY